MTENLKRYGILVLAAVLLVALVGIGAVAGDGEVVKPVVSSVTVDPASVQVDYGVQQVDLTAEGWPSGYAELEWITSQNAAWINTLIVPTLDYTTEVKAIKSSGYSLFGSGGGMYTFTGSSVNYAYIGGPSVQVVCDDQSVPHIWKITNRTAYCDDRASSRSTGTNQPVYPIALFARTTSATTVDDAGVHTIYYAKIWDKNGILVFDGVPAKRNSDGEVGMYDLVSGTFFTNAGSGSFIAGPEVAHSIEEYGEVTYQWYSKNSTNGGAWTLVDTTTTNSTTVSVSKLETTEFCVNASNIAGFCNTSATPVKFTVVMPVKPNVRNITVDPASVVVDEGVQQVNLTVELYISNLPMGYTELEWIKSSGTQWINTLIVPTLDYTTEVKATKSIGYSLFGSGLQGYTFTGSGSQNYAYISTSLSLQVECADQSIPHIWKIADRTAYCDDSASARSTGTNQPVYPIALFARTTSETTVNDGGLHTIYYTKIWDENGILVFDGVPAKRNSDNEIGMYDLVSNTFFTNQGTGSFTAGPEVARSIEDYGDVTYQWYARNATTHNEWVHVGSTANHTTVSVSKKETTEFCVNASNVAGFCNTSSTPVQFTTVMPVKPVVSKVTVDPASGVADDGVQQVNLNAELYISPLPKQSLPSGYTGLEYIESTGTQFIELPFYFTPTDTVSFRFSEVYEGQVSDTYMVSCYPWNTDARYAMGRHTTYTVGYGKTVTGGTHLLPETNYDNELPHTWHYQNYVFSVEEPELSLDVSTKTYSNPSGTIRLFFGTSPTKGKIYYYLHTTSTATYNLVPAMRNSDNEIGMYDIVNGVFYTNAGTGSFIAGPGVASSIEDYGEVTYTWYSQNSTNGGAWTNFATTNTNSTTVSVSKQENTKFCVNASNIAGFCNTSSTPVKFTVVMPRKPVVSYITVNPASVPAGEGVQQVNLSAILGQVPIDYTELEYIQATVGTYIDTGICAENGVDVEVKYTLTTTSNQGIFGVRTSNVRFWNILYGGKFEVGVGGDNPISATIVPPVVGTTYVHKLVTTEDGVWCAYYNGSAITDGRYPQTELNSETIWLFKIHAVTGTSYDGYCKMHYAKIWDGDENLVRDFIPAKRNSDNAIGMYDTVSGTFFTNDGTGSFTAGPEVVTSKEYDNVTYQWYSRNSTNGGAWTLVDTTSTNSTSVFVSASESTRFCVNASNIVGYHNTSATPVKFSAVYPPEVSSITVNPAKVQAGTGTQQVTVTAEPRLGGLPEGYTELEYLQSSNNPYINTGYKPNYNTELECVVQYWEYFIVGACRWSGSPQYDTFGLYSCQASGTGAFMMTTYWGCFQNRERTQTDTYTAGKKVLWKLLMDKVTMDGLDGYEYSFSDDISRNLSVLNNNNQNLWLFSFNNQGNQLYQAGNGRIYYFKIREGTELKRYFIPAKRNSDNEIGMYDLVEGKFYTNSGTGSFIAGPMAKEYGTVTYEWFARNATTKGWVSLGTTDTNSITTAVGKNTDTEFYVEASNIAGRNDSTKDHPAKFSVVYFTTEWTTNSATFSAVNRSAGYMTYHLTSPDVKSYAVFNDSTVGKFNFTNGNKKETYLPLNWAQTTERTGLSKNYDYIEPHLIFYNNLHPVYDDSVFCFTGTYLGDVNMDGVINMLDSLFIVQHLSTPASFSNENDLYGMVVTTTGAHPLIQDASAIAQYNVGLLDEHYQTKTA